jgi:hypothetical protein
VLKWKTLILLASTVLLEPGCGGTDSPFKYVQISGKLSYEDGAPIPADGIKLIFDSQAAPVGNAHPRQGSAMVSSDGAFKDVTSYKYGDGLVPGKHKVAIMYATDANGKLLVPPEYTKGNTTPLEIDTTNLPIEIKVPRPKG